MSIILTKRTYFHSFLDDFRKWLKTENSTPKKNNDELMSQNAISFVYDIDDRHSNLWQESCGTTKCVAQAGKCHETGQCRRTRLGAGDIAQAVGHARKVRDTS